MAAECKIIRLKQERTSIAALMGENTEGSVMTSGELKSVVTKARDVLDTMKEEWQEDHNSLVIMEQLCLLRNYLELLRQYYERNV